MQTSGAWGWTCCCEQMPCLSSPALTFSLGHVEHVPGQKAEVIVEA